MSEKRDYYEVLGVSRDASEDEVRKAYKKLALANHPDRNPDDSAAEMRFREATEAYSVLSDDEKRAQYDRFGHAGAGAAGFDFSNVGMGDILGQFQDLFSDFFGGRGGGGFGGAGGRRAPQRGQDIRTDAVIDLSQSMSGTKKEVVVRGAAPCSDCDGSGAKAGSQPVGCQACGGNGQVATQRGFIMFSTTCGQCRGQGQVIKEPCELCSGAGAIEKERRVVVNFPAGIDSGQRLRVPGQGMPGPGGAPSGDLYVDVELEAHERFEREGFDLIYRSKVSFLEAALGTKTEITLPNDQTEKIKISAGTQPGTVISLEGRGIPRLDRRSRGALHIVVDVHVPTQLSRKARKALAGLEDELAVPGRD